MAKKKKTKSKKRMTSAERVSKKEQAERNSFIKVVGTIIAIFITVFIALSNFSLCGSIGNIIRSWVLSFFGTFGYFFPIVMGISILISLFNSDRKSNIKIYSLLFFYISIICLFESLIHDFSIEDDYFNAINASIIRATNYFSFSTSNFSGGVVGTGISFLTYKAIGKVGSLILFGTLSLITFILLFGLGLSRDIAYFFRSIFLFVPNMIAKHNERIEEDRQIAIDNENILMNTIEKSKKANLKVSFDSNYSGNRLVLEPIEETKRRTFDTSNINITAKDIQSRFYSQENEVDYTSTPQSQLLNQLKKKSINEVLFEEKEKGITKSPFFYTDGMKPINELENINIPNKNDVNVFENSYINVTNQQKDNSFSVSSTEGFEDEEPEFKDDEKSFASGLKDLRDNDKVDENTNAKELLTNIKNKNIEFENKSLKNDTGINVSRKRHKKYKFPPTSFLHRTEKSTKSTDPSLNEKAGILVETLKQFGVGVTVTNITVGPSVTRFELKPDIGVKISKILSLENDVKLALAASEIRIEAPIPGKAAIGIEIANAKSSGVLLGDIVATSEFRNAESKLTVAIGKDISGKSIITDLRKMPHLLIAGATGSGKSVCVNSLITSLIYKASPEDVRLIMVDPKVVELQIYDGIPHLLIPVVTNPKKAAGALNWAVSEMTRRYNLIQEKRVRDIESYNQAIEGDIDKIGVNEDNEASLEPVSKLPYIVIIIDEFADLMMVASKDVENAIMRIAQLARACGIYLVIATQRPTVNVISGSIKTNVPSRISFAVSSGIDSQTILDRRGAEKLLGHGDMLYFPQGIPEPIRVQGCYVSEEEILNIVNFVKDDNVVYDEVAENAIEKGVTVESGGSGFDPNEKDDMFVEAGRLVIEQQNASIGMLQRRFRMGFNRAARVIDQLEAEGVISAQDGKKPREVLMSIDDFRKKFGG
ncbi:MAG: DNA translocase FtsK [Lachnospiraceae bacterium]|nr:DNA translocase FtsK [Lachnospiraceae bacterium]